MKIFIRNQKYKYDASGRYLTPVSAHVIEGCGFVPGQERGYPFLHPIFSGFSTIASHRTVFVAPLDKDG